MGIRVKHLSDLVVYGLKAGNAATGKVHQIIAPWPGIIVYARMKVTTAGATGSQLGDVNINGTSIFATAGNRLTLSTGTDAEASGSTTMDGTRTFVKGDLISVDIDQIHTTPAVDTTFQIVLRQRAGATVTDYAE